MFVALFAAGTAIASFLLGLLLGSSVSRSLSIGFYLVGCFLLVAGFFIGNRGPVRLKGEPEGILPFFGTRRVRLATPTEREELITVSAFYVAIGLALIAIGVAVDGRHTLL